MDAEEQPAGVTLENGRASGKVSFVDGGLAMTHLLVFFDSSILLLDCSSPQVKLTKTRAFGFDGLVQFEMNQCAASVLELDPALCKDLHAIRRLCLLARAFGAANRAFEMVVEYAGLRQQFGKPVGSFQAVAHKLANCKISLEGIRLLLSHASAQFDRGASSWRYFVSCAGAFSGPALRQVSMETHHVFGAIGYADEHEASRHFRRVHLDTLAMGGVRRARDEVAVHLLDQTSSSAADGSRLTSFLPRYDLGEAGNTFREEVAQWLEQNWSGERKIKFDALEFEHREFDASFASDLGKTGWIGLTWPREHGGQQRAPIEQIAFLEEMERAEAPRFGASVQATALILFGSAAQQQRYLPEILRGEAMHGMGYSEPNSGSDLASLKTSAVRDGDHWVINGQKIWTTTWWGKYMFLAARTKADARPAHAGISMFIVPMNTPGIQVKVSKTLYDGTFANIFYDNVRVPQDALLGEVDGGWKVLTSALASERGLVGGGIVLKVAHAFDLLCERICSSEHRTKAMQNDPLVRDRIAQLAAEIEVGRLLMIHCAQLARAGATPPEYGAISKVFSGELMERFGQAALEILGMPASLSQGAPGNILNGRFEQNLRHSLMWVISIGTNEIQRSLIAQRALGLPR